MSALSLDGQVACVRESPLFQGLTLSECTEIVSIAREQRFAKRQTLFRQGDPVKFVFVLLCGRVKITGKGRAGGEVILSVQEAGEPVGGLGLALGRSHSGTANALERCHVLSWEAQAFQNLCEQHATLGRNLVRVLDERMRLIEDRFRELVSEQVAPRLALTVVRLLKANGNAAAKKMSIGFSHRELAQMTGMTESTVSRLLGEWKHRGLVISQGKSLLVEDLPGLMTLAKAAA